MRMRGATRWYHVAARTWLTLAGLSLLLRPSTRLGLWLPLHLALAGAVSSAISGAMQAFVLALTATPSPGSVLIWTQFACVNAGAALVAWGRVADRPGVLAVGAIAFLVGIVMLGAFVIGARRRALNRRHPLPIVMYVSAIAAMLVGGALGALVGAGRIDDVDTYLGLRRAHMVLNVMGWVSLTITGTLITFLPTVLRIRMPSWHGAWTMIALMAGVAIVSAGLALGADAVAAAGGVVYLAGVASVIWMVGRAAGAPRAWPVPTAAKHLMASVVWFASGSLATAVALARGGAGFDGFRQGFLAMLVGGWALQTLLGAWQYLLPMARPGHPNERRRWLAAIEFGGRLQLLALNGGLLLIVLHLAGWLPGTAGSIGAGLALGGGALALLKAWAFPVLGRAPVLSERQLGVWGG